MFAWLSFSRENFHFLQQGTWEHYQYGITSIQFPSRLFKCGRQHLSPRTASVCRATFSVTHLPITPGSYLSKLKGSFRKNDCLPHVVPLSLSPSHRILIIGLCVYLPRKSERSLPTGILPSRYLSSSSNQHIVGAQENTFDAARRQETVTISEKRKESSELRKLAQGHTGSDRLKARSSDAQGQYHFHYLSKQSPL